MKTVVVLNSIEKFKTTARIRQSGRERERERKYRERVREKNHNKNNRNKK